MRTRLDDFERTAPAPAFPRLRRVPGTGCLALSILFAAAAGGVEPSSPRPPAGAAAPPCDNRALTSYGGLLVLASHPDDETLAFAGLVTAYMRQGKPVQVVVVTDGDAYCDACQFWKNGSVHGPTCSALDLSNFATPAVDSFAEVRRGESAAAAAILGRKPPAFLGYPDTGLGAAWLNSRRGAMDARLRRSDFSRCPECGTCEAGYGAGPETDLTAAKLVDSLTALLAAAPEDTLVATTHWLDGHADHAALGNFVKTIDDSLAHPRPVAYAVVHAHTPKSAANGDCWFPGPPALVCPCADEARATADPTFVADLRRHRLQPGLPAALPDDAPYGTARHLCLPEEMVAGENATKLAAVRAYRSQLGTLGRTGEVPRSLDAIIDCNGYLISFVRRTEAFVVTEPAAAVRAACDPAGAWEGIGGGNGAGAEVHPARLALARTGERTVSGYLALAGGRGGAEPEVVVGEFGAGCELALRVPGRERVTLRASVSKDGRSMYGSWDGETPGFLVLHR